MWTSLPIDWMCNWLELNKNKKLVGEQNQSTKIIWQFGERAKTKKDLIEINVKPYTCIQRKQLCDSLWRHGSRGESAARGAAKIMSRQGWRMRQLGPLLPCASHTSPQGLGFWSPEDSKGEYSDGNDIPKQRGNRSVPPGEGTWKRESHPQTFVDSQSPGDLFLPTTTEGKPCANQWNLHNRTWMPLSLRQQSSHPGAGVCLCDSAVQTCRRLNGDSTLWISYSRLRSWCLRNQLTVVTLERLLITSPIYYLSHSRSCAKF